MSLTVTIDEAQHDLRRLLARIQAGEEVVIEEGDKPLSRLVPISKPLSPKRRMPGTAKGQFEVPDDFNDPLPDEIVDAFYQ